MQERYFPIEETLFKAEIEPVILAAMTWKGRPPKVSHYKAFCGILYVLRTGIPWRDMPEIFGNWDAIYKRFSRGNERGLWWKILLKLQKQRCIKFNVVIVDSTSFKVHRHGGGVKGGSKARA